MCSASIHYSIWRYRHLECVTRAEIKAAVEEYGSVEDIPSVKYYVRGEDREDCNEILSGILDVSVEAKVLCWYRERIATFRQTMKICLTRTSGLPQNALTYWRTPNTLVPPKEYVQMVIQ